MPSDKDIQESDKDIQAAIEAFDRWSEQHGHNPDDAVVTTDLRAIAEATDAVQRAKAAQREAVQIARAHGWSWNFIAVPLGVSRQAARERFSPPPGPQTVSETSGGFLVSNSVTSVLGGPDEGDDEQPERTLAEQLEAQHPKPRSLGQQGETWHQRQDGGGT